jgi:hypothetical protein
MKRVRHRGLPRRIQPLGAKGFLNDRTGEQVIGRQGPKFVAHAASGATFDPRASAAARSHPGARAVHDAATECKSQDKTADLDKTRISELAHQLKECASPKCRKRMLRIPVVAETKGLRASLQIEVTVKTLCKF